MAAGFSINVKIMKTKRENKDFIGALSPTALTVASPLTLLTLVFAV